LGQHYFFRKIIASTQFNKQLINIKTIKNLIFVSTADEINVCYFNIDYNIIEVRLKIANVSPIFEIWPEMNYLVACFGTRIKIIAVFNELESHELMKFETGFTAIQKILFDSSYSILFVIDTQGTYIKIFALNKSSTEFNEISQLYLGKGGAIITSIVVIDDVFLAVNNSNKSIYIFKYKTDAQTTYFTRLYNILVNPYNTPIMKINYCDFNFEEDFFQKDFKRLGSLLLYNKENKILTSICHNGIVYKL
jgi:hypothetical protein